jgi:hypothetical protein
MLRRIEPPYRFLIDECLGENIVPQAVADVLGTRRRNALTGFEWNRERSERSAAAFEREADAVIVDLPCLALAPPCP